jgi:hypothetical protein
MLLASNVSIAPPDQPGCWQQCRLLHHTELFAQRSSRSAGEIGGPSTPAAPSAPARLVSLGFMRDALLLPAAAGPKFLLV